MAKQNLKTATKKAQYQSKVSQLDSLGTDINQFIQKESLSLVENILGDFVERVQNNINAVDSFVVTGGINDIEIKAEGNVVNVYANPWLLYQDKGVNGSQKKLYNSPFSYSDKKPPVQVFKDWIKRKGINTINNPKYYSEAAFANLTDEEKIDKAAWGMATKVYKEGFKPRNVYSKEIPKLVEDLGNEIADFAVQSVAQVIDVKPSAKRITK
jgi:dihydroneopterin aldolase